MDSFTQLDGLVAPMDRANVDTDQIIPKQYLKSIKRTGFGDYLFDAWRFLDQGTIGMTPNERQLNREFALNLPEYQGACILIARDNFGCGSSREHAVWALKEFGFRAVLAPSFADIFFNNCFKNGILPIALPQAEVDKLMSDAKQGNGTVLSINLEGQTITRPNGETIAFDVDPFRKNCLIEGLDDIGLTFKKSEKIDAFEAERNQLAWC